MKVNFKTFHFDPFVGGVRSALVTHFIMRYSPGIILDRYA
jgi:hypothetical protein